MTRLSLILASSSRYRQDLLSRLNYPFQSIAPDIDETPLLNETAQALSARLSLIKAQAIAQQYPSAVVIGSDQVLEHNKQCLGKPYTHERAVQQLLDVQGKLVTFYTSVSIVCYSQQFAHTDTAQVNVSFRPLTLEQIETYLKIEKPYDCAGSAKSEGLGITLLDRIESDDPTALIGLPLIRTARVLRTVGIDPLQSFDSV